MKKNFICFTLFLMLFLLIDSQHVNAQPFNVEVKSILEVDNMSSGFDFVFTDAYGNHTNTEVKSYYKLILPEYFSNNRFYFDIVFPISIPVYDSTFPDNWQDYYSDYNSLPVDAFQNFDYLITAQDIYKIFLDSMEYYYLTFGFNSNEKPTSYIGMQIYNVRFEDLVDGLGQCIAEPNDQNNVVSTIKLNQSGLKNIDIETWMFLIAHEFFHAITFDYGWLANRASMTWNIEAFAGGAALKYLVYKDVLLSVPHYTNEGRNIEYYFANTSGGVINQITRFIDQMPDSLTTLPVSYDLSYDKYTGILFAYFLMINYDNKIIKRIIEEIDSFNMTSDSI